MIKKRTEHIGTNVKQKNIYIYITQHTPGQDIELVCDVYMQLCCKCIGTELHGSISNSPDHWQ